jgi:hypothetical protein
MVGVLRDGDAHGKLRRVTATRNELCGTGGGDHGAVARAAILLADVMLDLIRQLDGGDALRRFALTSHLGQLAPARRALALILCELVSNVHDRQRRLLTWAVPWLGATRRARCRRVAILTLKNVCAGLMQLVLHREGQLLDIRNPTQPRELRGQLKVLRNEALVLAIEEQTDLAKRFDVMFVCQLHHSGLNWIIARDPKQAKNSSAAAA